MPLPPADWEQSFRLLQRDMQPAAQTLAFASVALARFIDPILRAEKAGDRDPIVQAWTRYEADYYSPEAVRGITHAPTADARKR